MVIRRARERGLFGEIWQGYLAVTPRHSPLAVTNFTSHIMLSTYVAEVLLFSAFKIEICNECGFSNLTPSWLVVGRYQVTTKRRLHRRSDIKAEVSYVNSDEAKKLIAVEGYAVVDVRDKTQFERAHIKNCYHAPLFIENNDNDLGTIIKRTVHNNFSGLFFGLPFTKPNPEFVQSVRSQFSPESKVLLVCQEGLRSAAAADKLEIVGYQNIACITSGLQSVKPGTFNSVGSTELQNAGKAGLITVQGKISAVLGTVLICAFLFITFFPDQAEKLFQLAPTS